MDVLGEVLARARADPGVLGVVLTGSHARGVATERSDYDVLLVVAEQEQPWRHTSRTTLLDEVVCTEAALADTSVAWQRYAYRGARVLLDRLDGGIGRLVRRQATLTAAQATRAGRAGLDAYVNQLYRSAKSRRDGFADAARLDEAESLPWLLETVFALHGRLRPYNKYLRWELDTYPLPGAWNAALDPAGLPGAAHTLFPAVVDLARGLGHGDVLDAWGGDVSLILSVAPG
jgi:predicted nucleotidyltransferase